MPEAKKARAVGFNHVALEVGDIEAALAFYARIFDFELRSKSDTAAFIDLGDQFIALQKGRTQPADDGRHEADLDAVAERVGDERGRECRVVVDGGLARRIVGEAADRQEGERQTEEHGAEQEEWPQAQPGPGAGATSRTRRWRALLGDDRGGVAHDRFAASDVT